MIFHLSDCNARLTSSSGRFTFCFGESVTLTCSLTSRGHTWRIPTTTTDIVLFHGHTSNSANGILFTVTGEDSVNITSSTMTFTASVALDDLIGNGSWVFCGGATEDNTSRITFNQTIDKFGE